jgi:pimeloyl-ACP methyl ester carboxylesterase
MKPKEIFFDTNDIRLHGIEGPKNGPPLVLLHGATSNCYSWMGLFPQLAENWHIYAFDLRGHGLSGRPANIEGYNLSYNITDTVNLLRGVVCEPAVLLGHSYGAVISALAGGPTAEFLRGIVLEDPPFMLRRDNQESNAFLDHFSMLYQLRQSTQNVEEILAAFSAQNPKAPLEMLRPIAQSLAWLDPHYLTAITYGNRRETASGIDFGTHFRAIRCPALILQADVAKGAALAQEDLDFFMANTPNARLVTFPGASHGIHTDQPDKYLRVLEEFMASLP